ADRVVSLTLAWPVPGRLRFPGTGPPGQGRCSGGVRSMTTALVSPSLAHLHARFLELLPAVERHGQIYFRHLGPHRKLDAIHDIRALAWKWFLRLHERGRDPADFVTSFTTLL